MDKNLFPMSSGASERASKELKDAECVSKASSGGKQLSEQSEQTIEWMSEWPSTTFVYSLIIQLTVDSGQLGRREKERQ